MVVEQGHDVVEGDALKVAGRDTAGPPRVVGIRHF